jgi:hypothetical protein
MNPLDFEFHYGFHSYKTFFEKLNHLNEFLRFMNQDIHDGNYHMLLARRYHKGFTHDVWDRKRCVFHASFSDANYGYLGLNNDFYQSPSKLFTFNESSMDFYLAFTTNGREYWLPRQIDFVVELTYIFDVEEVIEVI